MAKMQARKHPLFLGTFWNPNLDKPEIPSTKIQIPNKYQKPKCLKFEVWILKFIRHLLFLAKKNTADPFFSGNTTDKILSSQSENQYQITFS